MSRSNILSNLLIATVLTLTASSAYAGSYAAGCTKSPQASWMKIEDVESKVKSDGYLIMKSKVSGSCYEIYATKDGKRFELFYDPTTAQLASTSLK